MTSALAAKLAGRRVVASVSGGKDSAAMSLWLTEQGIDHDRVFMDTGWEHPKTYEYLRGPLTVALGPIVEIQSETMQALVRRKKMFPSGRFQFCTAALKLVPLAAHLEGFAAEVVNAVGIRAAESKDRETLPEWEWSDGLDCETWRPLLRWTMQEVVDAHRRHGLIPNPLYLAGAPRVGCWPCVRSNKEQLAMLDPARVAEIAALEQELGGPTMFAVRPPGAKKRVRLPIADVVRWAKTSDTGQTLLDDGGSPGCMRWGLCETNATRVS